MAVKKNKLERLPMLNVQALVWRSSPPNLLDCWAAIHQEPLAANRRRC